MLECLDPGLHSTIQDGGRTGWAHLGVARAGAADPLALAVANLLCANPPGAAALEMSLLGGRFAVRETCLVAITGADMSALVMEEGRALAVDAAHLLRAGSTLSFGPAVSGARTYLAMAGGIAAEQVLGSASTDPLAGFGGLGGRALRVGDRLGPVTRAVPPWVLPAERVEPVRRWTGPGAASGVHAGSPLVSLSPGPHRDLFPAATRDALVETDWRVSAKSDRVGVRLEGPPLDLHGMPILVSLPMLPGAVQVPPGGQPILLGPDAPTVGGYPVLGVVCAADLPMVGQLGPGDEVRFAWVSLDEALERMRRQRKWLDLAATPR